ncbi:hypothetical protein O6H91_03G048200 [Diphasiastrum complanatum]|uniref:Uncharacterized protein n=1 Tax=Diphasiastrum complanatum TaxID=34168 RepID=A0ACC2E654_DIPCM|nr:hypothetical protein O6H91_03G048200 [Diphasiastrum complanatum]
MASLSQTLSFSSSSSSSSSLSSSSLLFLLRRDGFARCHLGIIGPEKKNHMVKVGQACSSTKLAATGSGKQGDIGKWRQVVDPVSGKVALEELLKILLDADPYYFADVANKYRPQCFEDNFFDFLTGKINTVTNADYRCEKDRS